MDNMQLNRKIRLFVSSTFKDMETERDYLAHKVFPRLRSLCLSRNVEFVELDLRWGITQQESQNGKVAEICLSEIERTRPFFIGLLGNRYGWSPSEDELVKNPILHQRFPWINDDIARQCSITEIEMQFGALRFPEKLNAFFYLKGAEAQAEHVEGLEALQKLSNLKKQICEQHRYPVGEYHSVEELGERIIADFTGVLDELYPAEELSETTLLRIAQQAFKNSLTSIYIPLEGSCRKLDAFAQSDLRRLLLTGPVGSGKSALIANWSHKREDLKTISYLFEASPESEQMLTMMPYFAEEICSLFGLPSRQITDKESFKQLVSEVSDELIMLLDCSEHIDRLHLSEFIDLFSEVRILFSLPDHHDAIPDLEQRGFELVQIQEPDVHCRQSITNQYLGYFGKSLPDECVAKIINDDKLSQPYMLILFLKELRLFGIHEQIAQHIDHFLDAIDVPDLLNRLLDRAEREYGGGDHKYVERILSSIALSQNGLSEREIMDLSNTPPLYWSQLYAAMDGWFGYNSGKLYLYNPEIGRSVEKRYELSARNDRERIAAYFRDQTQESTQEKLRSVSELVWQYTKLEQWEPLYRLLLRVDVVTLLRSNDLKACWKALVAHGYSLDVYLEKDYSNESDSASIYGLYNTIASLCDNLGREQLFLRYKQQAIAIGKLLPYHIASMDDELRALGLKYISIGQFARAEEVLSAALEFSLNRKRDAPQESADGDLMSKADWADFSVSESYNALGVLCWHYKFYPDTVKMIQQAVDTMELIARKHPYMAKRTSSILGGSYNNLGHGYFGLQNYAQAEVCYMKSIEYRDSNLDKEIGNYDILETYNSLAILYRRIKQMDKAAKYHDLIINTYETINDSSGRYENDKWLAYYNATLFFDVDNPARAKELALKALDISERKMSSDVVAYKCNYGLTCRIVACLYMDERNFKLAEAYFLKAIAVFEKIQHDAPDNLLELCDSYDKLARMYCKMSSFDQSEEVFLQMIASLELLPIHSNREYLDGHYNMMCNMAYMYSCKFEKRYKKAISYVEKRYAHNPLCNIISMRLHDKWAASLTQSQSYRKASPIWMKTIDMSFRIMLEYPSPEILTSIRQDILDFNEMLDRKGWSQRCPEMPFIRKVEYLTNLYCAKRLLHTHLSPR